jgi:hypothetical protein
MVANACFYYGHLESFTTSGRPIWTKMTFEDAERNFTDAARHGITSVQVWPGLGRIPAVDLVADHLLSVADDGLAALGLRREVRSHFLSVIEGRCRTRTNGASWQVATTEAFEAAGYGRDEALREMLRHYLDHSEDNLPVHTWPVPEVEPVQAEHVEQEQRETVSVVGSTPG